MFNNGILIMLILLLLIAYFSNCGYIEHLTTVFNNYIGKQIFIKTTINNETYYLIGVDTNTCGIKNDADVSKIKIKFVLMKKEDIKGELAVANKPINQGEIKPSFRIDKLGYDNNFDDVLRLLNISDYMVSYNYRTMRPIGIQNEELLCLLPEDFDAIKKEQINRSDINFNYKIDDYGSNDGTVYLKIGTKYIGIDDQKCGKYNLIKLYDEKNEKVLKFSFTDLEPWI